MAIKRTGLLRIIISFLFLLSFCLIPFNVNPTTNFNQMNPADYLMRPMGVNVTNPADLVLDHMDSTINTITWNLSDEGPFDYLGEYSFTGDSNGADPSGWSITEGSADTEVQVIGELGRHRKIVEVLDDDTSWTVEMYDTYSEQENGSFEFWIYGVSGYMELVFFGFLQAIALRFYWDSNYLLNYRGGSGDQTVIGAPNLTTNTWHHFRIEFDQSDNTFDLYYDGVDQGTFTWRNNGFGIAETYFWSGTTPSSIGHIYLDAVDYSWGSGYYTNRNLDFTYSTDLAYAVFENESQQTSWQKYSLSKTVDYDISGLGLGLGIHNVSLVYNDTVSQLFHDDVFVNVTVLGDFMKPNIVSVTQDPPSPTYLERKMNITAHITENDQIQEVLIETNVTGSLENTSMSLLSGDLQNGIWGHNFSNLELNRIVNYRIFATDLSNNTNATSSYSFGLIDSQIPNIVEVDQDPSTVDNYEPVTITSHITENFEITSVKLESNYTGSWENHSMILESGTLQDSYWNYTIGSYLVNTTIRYRIFATDISGKTAVSGYQQFTAPASIFVNWSLTFNLNRTSDNIFWLGLGDTFFLNFTITNLGNVPFSNIEINSWGTYYTVLAPDPLSSSIPSLGSGESYNGCILYTYNSTLWNYVWIDFTYEFTVPATGDDYGEDHILFMIRIKKPKSDIPTFDFLIAMFGLINASFLISYIKRKRRLQKRKSLRMGP